MQASSAPADAVRAFADWFTTVLPREEEVALQGVAADSQQRLHAKLAALSPVATLLPRSAKKAARTATMLAPHAKRVRFVTNSDSDSGDDTGNKAAAAEATRRVPQQAADSAAKPSQNAAAAAPPPPVAAALRVSCPRYSKTVDGVYLRMQGVVNGLPWWSAPSGWCLYSSPSQGWTITKDHAHFASGRGVVACTEEHGGRMPWDPTIRYQVATTQGWQEDNAVRVTPDTGEPAAVQPAQQQQRPASSSSAAPAPGERGLLAPFTNTKGFLTRRGYGRARRMVARDPTVPPPDADEWRRILEAAGARYPAEGLTLAEVESLMSQSSQDARIQPPPPPPPPQQYQQQSASNHRGHRCGQCSACRNPKWKKPCTASAHTRRPLPQVRQPQAQPATVMVDAIEGFSDEDDDGFGVPAPGPSIPIDDLVGNLIGAVNVPPQPAPSQAPAKRPTFRPGVRLVDVVRPAQRAQ